jgi:O-antigen/teichoic acid export membrane protein
LFRNGLYIMGTTAATSLLGFGFWIVVARVLSAEEVGRASALVSAMLFVSVFTNLGIGQVFVSRLASRSPGHQWSLTVSTGLALVTIVSLVGGAVAAVLLPTLIPALKEGLPAGVFLLLPLGVAAVACSLILDFACIAERHAKLAFVRNTVAAVLRVAAIGVAALGALEGTTGLLAIWVGSFLLIDVFAITRTLHFLEHGFRLTLDGWRQELGRMRGLIAGHQTINLGAQASSYLLPVLVSARLGVTDNAYFYTTFMLSSALFFIAPAISNALFAEGAHAPDRLGENLRKAVKYILILAGPPAVVLLVAGPQILGILGPAYADEGATLLVILVGAAAFDCVLQLALAVMRVRQQLRQAAIATWCTLVTAIASSWLLLPPLGIEGAGVGWAIGKAVGVAVCAVYLIPRSRAAAAT